MSDIQRALLRKGYFPKELPSAFTTDEFGVHADDILAEWQGKGVFKVDVKSLGKIAKNTPRRGAYTYKIEAAEAEIISKPKRGFERRSLHITHPVPQALLAREIAQNWRSVQGWLSRQTYSEDEIRVSEQFERAIKGINFTRHTAKKLYLSEQAPIVVEVASICFDYNATSIEPGLDM